eukprot:GGOE01037019.1.p1 GENE.GGOE01037019.1~~GGOE01037019.1.p1  ORF type:complete len:699 (+),score=168.85 GGOE01037019.1:120-2216(+)
MASVAFSQADLPLWFLLMGETLRRELVRQLCAALPPEAEPRRHRMDAVVEQQWGTLERRELFRKVQGAIAEHFRAGVPVVIRSVEDVAAMLNTVMGDPGLQGDFSFLWSQLLEADQAQDMGEDLYLSVSILLYQHFIPGISLRLARRIAANAMVADGPEGASTAALRMQEADFVRFLLEIAGAWVESLTVKEVRGILACMAQCLLSGETWSRHFTPSTKRESTTLDLAAMTTVQMTDISWTTAEPEMREGIHSTPTPLLRKASSRRRVRKGAANSVLPTQWTRTYKDFKQFPTPSPLSVVAPKLAAIRPASPEGSPLAAKPADLRLLEAVPHLPLHTTDASVGNPTSHVTPVYMDTLRPSKSRPRNSAQHQASISVPLPGRRPSGSPTRRGPTPYDMLMPLPKDSPRPPSSMVGPEDGGDAYVSLRKHLHSAAPSDWTVLDALDSAYEMQEHELVPASHEVFPVDPRLQFFHETGCWPKSRQRASTPTRRLHTAREAIRLGAVEEERVKFDCHTWTFASTTAHGTAPPASLDSRDYVAIILKKGFTPVNAPSVPSAGSVPVSASSATVQKHSHRDVSRKNAVVLWPTVDQRRQNMARGPVTRSTEPPVLPTEHRPYTQRDIDTILWNGMRHEERHLHHRLCHEEGRNSLWGSSLKHTPSEASTSTRKNGARFPLPFFKDSAHLRNITLRSLDSDSDPG